MADIKYSIPKNYIVTENHSGLKGIVRRDKAGDKVTWEYLYKFLTISKTYGKILVAHLSTLAEARGENWITISNYKKERVVKAKVYDVLFGENFLYIKTVSNVKGTVEWCRVEEGLDKAKFIGEFEVVGRNPRYPHHIPVGTDFIIVKMEDGTTKKLMLHSGNLEDYSIPKPMPKATNKVQPFYRVEIDEVENRLVAYHTETGEELLRSKSIGEIRMYSSVIKALLVNPEKALRIDVENLFKFIGKFENYGNALPLIILYEYVKACLPSVTEGEEGYIMPGMLDEIESGWVDIGDGVKLSVYFLATGVLALFKSPDGIITSAPYIIEAGSEMFTQDELGALDRAYKKTNSQAAYMSIAEISVESESRDPKNAKDWGLPYSINQRPEFAVDIRDYSYTVCNTFQVKGKVCDIYGAEHGEISIMLGLCRNFYYWSKNKSRGQYGEKIQTNTCLAVML